MAEKSKKLAETKGKYVQTKGPTKTFQKDGHWIEKPNTTPILICTCGNRYIATRPNQRHCLRCMSDLSNRKNSR